MLRSRFISSFLLTILVSFLILSSCSIEKRHYQRGFHIEWNSGRTNYAESVEDHEKQMEVSTEEPVRSEAIATLSDSSDFTTDNLPDVSKKFRPAKSSATMKPQVYVTQKDFLPELDPIDNTANPEKTQAQIHPAAAGSLLFGILSALCFLGLFITSFNPLGVVIALTIGLFAFAILAKRMSKRAFEDMHYARNRYSGRGLAAAGLALSVITVVAFIGLLAVMLFGIAFTNLV